MTGKAGLEALIYQNEKWWKRSKFLSLVVGRLSLSCPKWISEEDGWAFNG
jgi:hypothetical protein